MTDVSLDVSFFPFWVHTLLINVVHPNPGFSWWLQNYFNSVSFLHIAALQLVFMCGIDNLQRVNITCQEKKSTLKNPFSSVSFTQSSLYSSIWKRVRRVFLPPFSHFVLVLVHDDDVVAVRSREDVGGGDEAS